MGCSTNTSRCNSNPQQRLRIDENIDFKGLEAILDNLQECLLSLKTMVESIHERYEKKKYQVAGLQQHPVSLLTLG